MEQSFDSNISNPAEAVKVDKKQKRRFKRSKVKEDATVYPAGKTSDANLTDENNGSGIIALLVSAALFLFVLSRLFAGRASRQSGTNFKEDDDVIRDYLSRTLLPRREYYREVYLKSEAWARKRYVVLKRDNWQCVYCGGKATEVHHKRYARKNIGKEPIEWLVSICRSCHEAIHQR